MKKFRFSIVKSIVMSIVATLLLSLLLSSCSMVKRYEREAEKDTEIYTTEGDEKINRSKNRSIRDGNNTTIHGAKSKAQQTLFNNIAKNTGDGKDPVTYLGIIKGRNVHHTYIYTFIPKGALKSDTELTTTFVLEPKTFNKPVSLEPGIYTVRGTKVKGTRSYDYGTTTISITKRKTFENQYHFYLYEFQGFSKTNRPTLGRN